MALKFIQVTQGAAATQLSSTQIFVAELCVEGDDGNSNPTWVGDSTVTSSNGIRLNNSATVPGRVQFGPYSGIQPIDLSQVYVVGTNGEKVNVVYVQN